MSKAKQNKQGKIEVVRLPQALVFNPKVEQVVRSIYFGYDYQDGNPLKVSSMSGTALAFFEPDAYVDVGIADAQGYRFMPESNSALISLGYHPTAVLLWLSRMTLNGEPVLKVQDDRLVATHAAVCQCARDVVFNYEQLELIKGKPRVVARPILDTYRAYVLANGKPEKFA
jgi:hypothetical protein